MIDRRFLDVSLTIKGIANSPATNPSVGTQYIVGTSPSGSFAGAKSGQLAYYTGSEWIFFNPKENGLEVFNIATKEFLKFNGTAWVTEINLSTEITALSNNIGDLSSLETSNKSSIIAAINEVKTTADNVASSSSASQNSLIFVDYAGKSGKSIWSSDMTAAYGTPVEGDKYVQEGGSIKNCFYIYTSKAWKQQANGLVSKKFLSINSSKIFYGDSSLKSMAITDTLVVCKENSKAYFYDGTAIKELVS